MEAELRALRTLLGLVRSAGRFNTRKYGRHPTVDTMLRFLQENENCSSGESSAI